MKDTTNEIATYMHKYTSADILSLQDRNYSFNATMKNNVAEFIASFMYNEEMVYTNLLIYPEVPR